MTLPSIAEEMGGSGGTLDDATTILRAAGRYGVPLPLAETGFLAGWLLERAGLHVPSGPLTVAPARAGERLELSSRDGVIVVRGRATRVPWAAKVDRLAVLAEDADGTRHVVVVPTSACRVEPDVNLAGEPRDDVVFDDVAVAGSASAAVDVGRDAVQLRGAFARSVMTLGALEATRDHGLAYATERQQFGRPIARFQAVQDLVAVSARDTALARVAVELAVGAARRDGGQGHPAGDRRGQGAVRAGRRCRGAQRAPDPRSHRCHQGASAAVRDSSPLGLARRLRDRGRVGPEAG